MFLEIKSKKCWRSKQGMIFKENIHPCMISFELNVCFLYTYLGLLGILAQGFQSGKKFQVMLRNQRNENAF